tara:strand:+ start:23044 stop:23310 length:267 start_codon:yes stop_codon:yes gene_type:complete
MALNSREKDKARFTKKGIAEAITTNDAADVSDIEFKIYVGTGGDLKVDTTDGQTITLKNIASGTYIDWIEIRKIYRTGTTARDIVAIY